MPRYACFGPILADIAAGPDFSRDVGRRSIIFAPHVVVERCRDFCGMFVHALDMPWKYLIIRFNTLRAKQKCLGLTSILPHYDCFALASCLGVD